VKQPVRYTLGLLALTWLLLQPLAFAGVEIRQFDNSAYEQRYHHLIDELRCLVCQNQNLADSHAQLAGDLRNIVYEMINQGKSDKEITDYMVARYGEFVLYKPPLDKTTFLLWTGPALLPLILIFFVFRFVRKRAKAAPLELSEEERRRSQKLLSDEDEDPKS
jgi:cytochrome c-type biogenesis protein CcmH